MIKDLKLNNEIETKLTQLTLQTWRFDFEDSRLSELVAKYYFNLVTKSSTHALMFEVEGQMAGILFGHIPNAPLLRNNKHQIENLKNQFIGLANKSIHDQWYKEWLINSDILLNQLTQLEPKSNKAWIDLLITDVRWRGRGIGRQLIEMFEKHARYNMGNNHSDYGIYLFTDTWCNWQFYERLDYHKKLERMVSDNGQTVGSYFIYKKSLT